MKIGVLGTGMVGGTIGTRLVGLGHEVKMGAREAGNEKALTWVHTVGGGASKGSFADAAAFGELVVNCTAGMHSIAALEAAGADNLAGKVLIDVANALDFSGGFPPTLAVSNTSRWYVTRPPKECPPRTTRSRPSSSRAATTSSAWSEIV